MPLPLWKAVAVIMFTPKHALFAMRSNLTQQAIGKLFSGTDGPTIADDADEFATAYRLIEMKLGVTQNGLGVKKIEKAFFDPSVNYVNAYKVTAEKDGIQQSMDAACLFVNQPVAILIGHKLEDMVQLIRPNNQIVGMAAVELHDLVSLHSRTHSSIPAQLYQTTWRPKDRSGYGPNSTIEDMRNALMALRKKGQTGDFIPPAGHYDLQAARNVRLFPIDMQNSGEASARAPVPGNIRAARQLGLIPA